MTSKAENKVYKSFEQMKAQLFPSLVEEEKAKRCPENIDCYAESLANKSLDVILNRHKEHNKSINSDS